jgi:peptidoglycan/xylan/chitin deacetylase (PgdA/CDA1 family)
MLWCSANVGAREQLAKMLGKAGGTAAILRARARLRLPVLSILTYHHVCDPGRDYRFDPDTADVSPDQFRRQMALVKRHFTVIGVDELLASLDGAKLPPNPCLITFDDGYRSNLDVAMPILRDLDMKAVFFIATSFVTERRLYWWDRVAYIVAASMRERIQLAYPRPMTIELRDRAKARAALVKPVKDEAGLDLERYLVELAAAAGVPLSRDIETKLADELIMTWDEVRQMRDAGMDIESHSRHHRVLQTLDATGLRDDLDGARADLARELGAPSRVIAYPVGRTIAPFPKVRDAVAAAGYQCGLTNASGVVPLWKKIDRLDVGRVALDRAISDEMFLAQLAIPLLSYQRQ